MNFIQGFYLFRTKYLTLLLLATLLINENVFSQQTESIPTEIKKTIDDLIQKGVESEKSNDFNQAAFYYHQVGNAYWSSGFSLQAIEFLKKSLSYTERLNNQNGLAVLETKLGLIYSEIKDYNSSLNHFIKSLDLARKMNRKPDVASSLLNVANTYYEIEKYNESITYLNEAELLSKDLTDPKMLRNCYSLMTRVYDKIGEREKSTEYFNLFSAITKKVQQEEIQKKEKEAKLMVDQANSKVKEVVSVKEATEKELKVKSQELVEKQVDLEKVEQISTEQQMKIDLLSKEAELQQAIIHQQKLMRNVYLTVIIAVLMLTGLILYGNQRIRKANVLLRLKNIEISQQKDEIEKQAEKLSELNALKDKLFSIISHDLRSPLFSLISMLNMAKDGHFTMNEQKEILNELSKNVEYNTELLENLLKWAASQMKGNVVKPVLFDINQVTLNKINLYNKTANQKGIKLNNSILDNTEVYADKDMIELVLRNLITNAIKFSESGDEITITSSISDGMVKVCVEDNGLGISAQDLEKLFGKHIFSTRGTLDEKGTGLGLILSKDFIQMNGGSIWVESELNAGSKFYFTLPGQRV
ncbi:MAG: ATP-binding protein [Tenuifilaceae bacterium]